MDSEPSHDDILYDDDIFASIFECELARLFFACGMHNDWRGMSNNDDKWSSYFYRTTNSQRTKLSGRSSSHAQKLSRYFFAKEQNCCKKLNVHCLSHSGRI